MLKKLFYAAVIIGIGFGFMSWVTTMVTSMYM